MSKYILVTSGGRSRLGKDVAVASVASLLKCCGLSVAIVKCVPYINVDAAKLSPYFHGGVFVTDDGSKADMDVGTYFRFTHISLTHVHSATTGKIYSEVIKNEQAGLYNVRIVQVVPRITDEIKRRILAVGLQSGADVVVVEIRDMVGDIELILFLKATRQLIREQGKSNILSIYITLVPELSGGELKTKPTKHSVEQPQETGIQPDILLRRVPLPLSKELRRKFALFCNVSPDAVFTSVDEEKTVYELSALFHRWDLERKILEKLSKTGYSTDISCRKKFLWDSNHPERTVTVTVICSRNVNADCWESARESFLRASVSSCQAELVLRKIDAKLLEPGENGYGLFSGADGIIIPGSTGQQGFLGILAAIRYTCEQPIPFLGIELCMQLMAVEAARTLLGQRNTDSTEFVRHSLYPVISFPEEQFCSGTICVINSGSALVAVKRGRLLSYVYHRAGTISECHGSKYSFNRCYTTGMESRGLIVSVQNIDDSAAAFEWVEYSCGIRIPYHPEFISRLKSPHLLFPDFIAAAVAS